MTNLLYRCILNDSVQIYQDEPRQVLLRIYGHSQQQGDMRAQLEIFNQLATSKLGPRLHSSFNGGRLEEYLPSSPLTWAELTDVSISRVIAKKIAAIHKLHVQSLDKNSNWLLEKYNQYNNFFESTRDIPIEFSGDTMESTRKIATELMAIDFKPEIELLAGLFKSSKAPFVFSHNDLHQNNIILLHGTDNDLDNRIVLIDFEYCGYNYRTFDIANHLSEWCFDYNGDDYPNFTASLDRFPSEERQRQFLADYLSEMGPECKDHFGGQSLSESDRIEILFDEMQSLFMASNLLWCIWAINGARTSKIKFGYWEMAKYKWDIYLLCKERFKQRSRAMVCHDDDVLNALQPSRM